jgi:quercetin dioxygenase-like cupin family protein
MSDEALRSLTPGAKRAGPGEYFFDLKNMAPIMGGPAYSTSSGPCVEGDRLVTALMTLPAGNESVPHNHPNEQWIFIVEGTVDAEVGGVKHRASKGELVYIPSNVVHGLKATSDRDVVFFTAKDASFSLQGGKRAA